MIKTCKYGALNPIRLQLIVTTIIALVVILLSSGAHGATVTYAFSGFLSQVDVDLQPTLSVNDPFIGIITLDDSAPDSDPSTSAGVYRDVGAGTVTVAGLTYTFNNKDVLFRDNLSVPPDLISLGGLDNGNALISGPDVEGYQVANTFFWVGDDTNLDLVVGDDFQPINFDLSDPDRREFFLSFGGGGEQARGVLTTFNPVPIPPALWLFGSGLLSLVGMARRKKAA